MITLYCWNVAEKSGSWLSEADLAPRAGDLRAGANVLWIDLESPTEAEERLILETFFPVHPLTLEDIRRLRRLPDSAPHFPKVEEFKDYLFVIVNPLAPRVAGLAGGQAPPSPFADGRATTQLSAVLTHTLLITHHEEPVASVRELKTHLAKHQNQADRGPDYLFHLVLDAIVDQYAPVLDHFDDALDDLEARVFAHPTQELLARLLQLKREIILLRKTLIYEREVLARLARGEFDLIDDREMVYYRNVYDHVVRFTELIESSREMVSDLMQTHLSAASNRLNQVMKVLTTISTLILPMSLIAGIYGMNFKVFPELEWPYGYPFALGLMLVSALGSLAYFRWRRWL